MTSLELPAGVFRVREDFASEASEALAQAFLEESATNYFFPPEEGNKLEKLRALFQWAMRYRVALDIPAFGVFSAIADPNERPVIAGAATLRIPKMPEDMGLADQLWKEYFPVFGPKAGERFEVYEQAQKKHAIARPHHYLVAIGIRPELQGRGYGGKLLRATIQLAEADPDSEGVGLDTSSDESQSLYERFGFKVMGREQLGDKMARFMFRQNTR